MLKILFDIFTRLSGKIVAQLATQIEWVASCAVYKEG